MIIKVTKEKKIYNKENKEINSDKKLKKAKRIFSKHLKQRV